MLLLFYFFAVISIWLGLLSLRGGVRFVRYLQTESAKDYIEFNPFVTVFMPVRGVDEGLRQNVAAIFAQHYPSFEIIFVTDMANDPALAIIEAVAMEAPQGIVVHVDRGIGVVAGAGQLVGP